MKWRWRRDVLQHLRRDLRGHLLPPLHRLIRLQRREMHRLHGLRNQVRHSLLNKHIVLLHIRRGRPTGRAAALVERGQLKICVI
jgi:hypothetical protein